MKEKIVKQLQICFWELLFTSTSKIEVYKELVHYMEGMDGMLSIMYNDSPTDEFFEAKDMLSRYITKYAKKIKKSK